MTDKSKIEWTDATFNPWLGCTKVSPACDNCYAEAWAKRSGQVEWGAHADRKRTSETTWNQPFKWQQHSDVFFADHGRHRRVFCASLADVFDNQVPAEWRADLFALIQSTPDLRWQILTKRIGNVEGMVDADFFRRNQHVGLMITVINQEEADRDISKLLDLKARLGIRWVGLSCEPLLGPIDFNALREFGTGENLNALSGLRENPFGAVVERRYGASLDWVIAGFESGPGARWGRAEWIRSIVRQCRTTGTACYVKQMGKRVIDRNDAGFEGCDDREWNLAFPEDQVEHEIHGHREEYQGADCLVKLDDPKGGDPAEWPADLRVREFPEALR